MKFKSRLIVVFGFLFTLAALAGTAAARSASAAPAIPAGTQVQVRIIENLSSESARVGDTFHGTLQAPIFVNGRALYPKGSNVSGQVTGVHRSGRLSDPGVLELTLTSVSYGRSSSPLNTQLFRIKGESHTKSNLEKIGGSTAAGAIIGAIAGGGKGAAIGAGVGAAAGTGVAAATGRKEAKVQSEAVLAFVTLAPPAQISSAPPVPVGNYEERPAYRRHGREDDDEDDDRDDDRREDYYSQGFSLRDRRIIRSCFTEDYSGLPPGLAKRDRLPPGLERQLRRNGTLPPGLQKRVQPLPDVCVRRLPRLPGGWIRVVLSGRVMLLDSGYRILDLFMLEGGD